MESCNVRPEYFVRMRTPVAPTSGLRGVDTLLYSVFPAMDTPARCRELGMSPEARVSV